MTSIQIVERVLLIEATLLAITILVIIGHALSFRSSSEVRVPRLERGRVLLYGGLQRGEIDDSGCNELCAFPRTTQIRLFRELAPSLVGKDREWLADVAERCGLAAYARRRCGSLFWWRRLSAARILTLFGRVEGPFLALANDRHPLVRAQVAEAFGLAPTPRGIELLIQFLGDKHPFVRFMSRDSLVRLGRDAHAAVLQRITDPQEPNLVPLLGIAATSPTHAFAPAVIALTSDNRAAVRAAAAHALRAIGGSDSSAQLARMLDDSDAEVRRRAVDGLAALNFWPAAPAIAKLIDAPEWDVRYRAALALQNLGGPGELLLRRAAERETPGTAIARRVLDAAAQLRAEAAS